MTLSTKSLGVGPSPFVHQKCLTKAEAQLVRSLGNTLKAMGSHCQPKYNDCFHPPRPNAGGCKPHHMPCHTSPPRHQDSCHPAGSLKTDKNGVVTTPGGYKIESTDQYAWKITGPDGKSTRVWGDPHVEESDGGKWDFKRDSTFVLGDGTRINVTTTPNTNGMTLTKNLEIISGNDRVQISDLDKGKGKTGAVTHDGFAHVNSFGGNDVFVMGKETDDWSFQGKEVLGSNNGGDSFKLGNALPAGGGKPAHMNHGGPRIGAQNAPGILPGEPNPTAANPQDRYARQLQQLFQGLSELFSNLARFSGEMEQHHMGGDRLEAPGNQGPWIDRRRQHLDQGFQDMGRMMDAFTRMNELRQSIQNFRGNFTV